MANCTTTIMPIEDSARFDHYGLAEADCFDTMDLAAQGNHQAQGIVSPEYAVFKCQAG